MYHVDVKDTKDTSIPVWVVAIPRFFMRERHNIRVSPGVDRILLTPHVVCCVVNAHCLVAIHPIVDYLHCVLFILWVVVFGSWTVSEQVRQQKVLEVWIETLLNVSMKMNLELSHCLLSLPNHHCCHLTSGKCFREIPGCSRCDDGPLDVLEAKNLISRKELRGADVYYLSLSLVGHVETRNHVEDLILRPCSPDWVSGGECMCDAGAWRSGLQKSLFYWFLHRSALRVDVQVRPGSLNINCPNFGRD